MAIVLRPSDPRVSAALASFLSRQGCEAWATNEELVVVELPHDLHDDQARLELELYVRLWQVLHGVDVDFLDGGRSQRPEEPH